MATGEPTEDGPYRPQRWLCAWVGLCVGWLGGMFYMLWLTKGCH